MYHQHVSVLCRLTFLKTIFNSVRTDLQQIVSDSLPFMNFPKVPRAAIKSLLKKRTLDACVKQLDLSQISSQIRKLFFCFNQASDLCC